MANYHRHINPQNIPQTQPLPGAGQVENTAGGYVFPVDDWKRLDRFLILGCEGGTYYATEQALTLENAAAVMRCIKADGRRVVLQAVAISQEGRAPKADAALFVHALCFVHGDEGTKQDAEASLALIARIPTHLAKWVTTVRSMRGFGRRLKRAIRTWIISKDADDLAYTFCKYQSREGWSTKDLLRVSHPKPPTPEHDALFAWACEKKDFDLVRLPGIVSLVEAAKGLTGEALARAVRVGNLTREMVPTEALADPIVLGALLERQPITATIRNLGNLAKHGVLVRGSAAERIVCERLRDVGQIAKGRLHPFSVLLALKTYGSGHGFRGSGEWKVEPRIMDALEDCYRLSFANVAPTGAKILIGIDVSGSMSSTIDKSPLTAREATTAIASIIARTETDVEVMAFSNRFIPAPGNWSRDSIDTLCKLTNGMPFETTDCAQPMLYAIKEKRMVDLFLVLTDNETFAGKTHPITALGMYRRAHNPKAKLVVAAMTSTGFTIADPNDAGCLDIVGLDASIPQLIADFTREQ